MRSFLEDLPLNGRKYTDFTLLSPNTSSDGDTGLVGIAGQQGGEDSGYANGNGSTAFTVDGSNATSNYFGDILGRYRVPYLYGENSIQEFQVAVNPYSAVYGGAGGFVNSVTRSGTNEFYGDLFYYNRNSAFRGQRRHFKSQWISQAARRFATIRRRPGWTDPPRPSVVLRGLRAATGERSDFHHQPGNRNRRPGPAGQFRNSRRNAAARAQCSLSRCPASSVLPIPTTRSTCSRCRTR